MHTQRVNIFNKAYSNHIIFGITYYFQLQFFPSQNGLLYQNLTYQTCLKTSGTYGFQFFYIIYKTAAGSTHGISRTKYYRISQFISNRQCLIYTVCYFTSRHFNTEAIHSIFKFDTVFPSFNSIYLNTDNFYIILVQNTCFCKFRTKIQSRLTSQVWQNSIRTLFSNNLLQAFYIQGLYIGYICDSRVCHDRCRIGIHQHNLIPQLTQCFTRLSS